MLSMALLVWGTLLAATKSVDLDGRPGAESAVDLNVLQTFPPRIENKVTNRTLGRLPVQLEVRRSRRVHVQRAFGKRQRRGGDLGVDHQPDGLCLHRQCLRE